MGRRPFSNGNDQLRVELDRPHGPYYPGDAIRVRIAYQPRGDVRVRELRATLAAWETYIDEDREGRTTRQTVTDQTVAEEVVAVADTISASSLVAVDLDWRLPDDAMPPYAGRSLVSGWSIRVGVDLEHRRDVSADVALPVIIPVPAGDARPGQYGEASHPEAADMSLRLPGLEWAEGEALRGTLIVLPYEGFNARQVRVRLVRLEAITTPRLRSTSTQVVSSAKLAGKTRFVAHQMVEFPFSLDVPVLGCPSRRTQRTTVTHTLEAALGRGLRKGYQAAAEVAIYGGRRA